MITDVVSGVAGLSLPEKWLLAVKLWDEVEAHQEELPADQALLDIVEQRFADYDRDPSTAMTLDEFKRQYRLP